MNKKRKKEAIFKNAKNILPKLLIFVLFIFSLVVLSGLVTSESVDNSLGNSKGEIFFDIKIINFESPMELGEFFEFTYLVKGMADINKDIEIHFWIEKQGEIITSGSDTIYIRDFEEKIETTKIFLPKNVESGIYDFIVEVIYGDYEAKSHRTIEIEIKKGIAKITTAEGKVLNTYLIFALIALAIFVLSLIFFSERKKIKKQFLEGEKWIKKYKIFVLTLSLFIILGALMYYLDFFGKIIKGISKLILVLRINVIPYLRTSSFYYILGITFTLVILIFLIIVAKKKGWFKNFKIWWEKRKVKQAKIDKLSKEKYKARVKESKIKFKQISKVQGKFIRKIGVRLKTFLGIINPLRLIKPFVNFLKKNIILLIRLTKKHRRKEKKKTVLMKKLHKKRKREELIKKRKERKKELIRKRREKKEELKERKRKKIKRKIESQKLLNKYKIQTKKISKIDFKKVINKFPKIKFPKRHFLKPIIKPEKSLEKEKKLKIISPLKTKKFLEEEKKALKNAKKQIKQVYKDVFRLLKKILGKGSYKKITQEFEKNFIKTGKLTQQYLANLKNLIDLKKFKKKQLQIEFEKDKLNFQNKINKTKRNARVLIKELTTHLNDLISLKKRKRIKTKEPKKRAEGRKLIKDFFSKGPEQKPKLKEKTESAEQLVREIKGEDNKKSVVNKLKEFIKRSKEKIFISSKKRSKEKNLEKLKEMFEEE